MLKSESMWPGFPDDVLLAPGGRHAFIEFKTEVGRLSAAQSFVHGILRRLGHEVHVVRSVAEFNQVLAALAPLPAEGDL